MFSLALTWLPQSHWVAEGQYQLFLKSDSSLSLSSMRCTAVYVPRDRWAAWARASASPSVVCWRAGESLPWKKPRRLASPRFLWRLRRGTWRMLWRIAPCWAASWPLAYRDLSPQWYQFINWPRFDIYLWLFFLLHFVLGFPFFSGQVMHIQLWLPFSEQWEMQRFVTFLLTDDEHGLETFQMVSQTDQLLFNLSLKCSFIFGGENLMYIYVLINECTNFLNSCCYFNSARGLLFVEHGASKKKLRNKNNGFVNCRHTHQNNEEI